MPALGVSFVNRADKDVVVRFAAAVRRFRAFVHPLQQLPREKHSALCLEVLIFLVWIAEHFLDANRPSLRWGRVSVFEDIHSRFMGVELCMADALLIASGKRSFGRHERKNASRQNIQ
jgi:hypothetical protein